MDRIEFFSKLEADNQLEYQVEFDTAIIHNTVYDTYTQIDLKKLHKMTWEQIKTATHHGKNVENITRVTGFFSKVSGWNKGKTGELKERDRGGKL